MIRLDPLQYEEVLEKDGCRPMDFTGKIMKGYVFVEIDALNTKNKLQYWLKLALDFNGIAKSTREKNSRKKNKYTMQSKATTVVQYLAELPAERQAAITKLRKVILKTLPKGFKEGMSYGMLGYFVPHTIYPKGYHCKPQLPLPFINLASQKNAITLYHMGIYGDPKLKKWFEEAYAETAVEKLDMGGSCIRFKKPENIPYDLIGELCSKVTVAQWIATYEKNYLSTAAKKNK